MKYLEFKQLQSEAEFVAGYELMRQLRPNLVDVPTFTQQVKRQSDQGYRLSGLWQEGRLVGLIGFRETECMLYGRHIYVDDLVVDASQRGLGFGVQLLNTVRNEAKQLGCAFLVLDTGLHKSLAQRFYFREGMLAKGMHFVQDL